MAWLRKARPKRSLKSQYFLQIERLLGRGREASRYHITEDLRGVRHVGAAAGEGGSGSSHCVTVISVPGSPQETRSFDVGPQRLRQQHSGPAGASAVLPGECVAVLSAVLVTCGRQRKWQDPEPVRRCRGRRQRSCDLTVKVLCHKGVWAV